MPHERRCAGVKTKKTKKRIVHTPLMKDLKCLKLKIINKTGFSRYDGEGRKEKVLLYYNARIAMPLAGGEE